MAVLSIIKHHRDIVWFIFLVCCTYQKLSSMFQIQTEQVAEQRKFKGIASSLIKIWREEGLLGYFKGNGTNVVRIVPYIAVQFAAYEEFKKVKQPSSQYYAQPAM